MDDKKHSEEVAATLSRLMTPPRQNYWESFENRSEQEAAGTNEILPANKGYWEQYENSAAIKRAKEGTFHGTIVD